MQLRSALKRKRAAYIGSESVLPFCIAIASFIGRQISTSMYFHCNVINLLYQYLPLCVQKLPTMENDNDSNSDAYSTYQILSQSFT